MKLTKVLTTAAAAVSMMAASTAFAAAPAAAKLSVSNASAVKALRAGGINKNAKSNSLPSWLPPWSAALRSSVASSSSLMIAMLSAPELIHSFE